MARDLAAAWNESGVLYSIAHGVDDFPISVGRDLDILVNEQDESRLLTIARESFRRHGWQVVAPPNVWGERLVAFSRNEGLELHTVRALSWREVRLAESPDPRPRAGSVFPGDPWASFVKQVLLPGFHGDLAKVRSNWATLSLNEQDRQLIKDHLGALVPGGAQPFATSIPDKAVDDLIDALPRLRFEMVRWSWLRSPLASARTISNKVVQRLKAMLLPTGVALRVLAPPEGIDGLVKSLEAVDKSVFTELVIRQSVESPGRGFTLCGKLKRALLNRVVLGGQRVLIEIVDDHGREKTASTGRMPLKFDAIVRVGRSNSADLEVEAEDPTAAAARIVQVAVDAFVRRHAKAGSGRYPGL